MPTALENLKNAERDLLVLVNALPGLDLSLDHRLRVFFPQLPADACTDSLFLNEEVAAEAAQAPTISSQSVTALIDQCYLTGQIPTFVQGAARIYNYAYTLDNRHLAAGISAPALEKYLEFVVRFPEMCVRDALSDFWQTPHQGLNGQPPKTWLSQFARSLIRNEASVRHADTTLSPAAMEVIDQAMPGPDTVVTSPLPSPYSFYTLTLNGHVSQPAVALYGAFVITTTNLPLIFGDAQRKTVVQDATPRPVVLYLPGSGLEAFDSLAALTLELGERLKDPYQRDTLLDCTLAEERVRALAREQVDYSPVARDNVSTFYSEQLIHKQALDMRHAWSQARAQKQDSSLDELSECVDLSLASSLPLKPANILRNRYTRLVESQLPGWLKNASDANKSQWRLAVERLNH